MCRLIIVMLNDSACLSYVAFKIFELANDLIK